MGCLTWNYDQLLFGVIFLSLSFPSTLSSLLSSSSLTTASLCQPDQSHALLQFKSSFTINHTASMLPCDSVGVTSHPKTETWKVGLDCCLWDGITCNKLTGDVIGLDLSCSWLTGSIHSNNTLFLLSHLQSLNLAFNDFSGSSISSNFGQFSGLTLLNLSDSRLSGLVPSEISHLSKLSSLDLSNNFFLELRGQDFGLLLQNLTELGDLVLDSVNMSSVAPGSLLNVSWSLKFLSLRNCYLEGNLPENVFQLPNLQELNLGQNFMLNGSLPKFNWSSPLTTLHLYGCNFVGSLPTSIGNLTKITSILLDFNHFTGPIPSSMSNLESLVELWLASNNFSGAIPNIFQNLSKLVELDISYNYLSGQIPASLFDLKQLSLLGLYHNQLSSPLPYENNISLSTLTKIDLSGNKLNGTIPPSLFVSSSVKYLDLSGNQFTGPIPSSIFKLVNVTTIILSSNNLSGTLDLDMFSELKNLNWLDLSENSLSLKVNNQRSPTWPMLYYLGLSSCNITSFPLFLRTQNQLIGLALSRNRIRGEIPAWLWLLGNTSLTEVDLSYNYMIGIGVPHEQFWSKLGYLDISFNLFRGPISPLINLFQHRSGAVPTILYFASNNFTGELASSICNITSLRLIDFSNNSLSGVIPECLGVQNQLAVLKLRMNYFSGPIPRNFSTGRQIPEGGYITGLRSLILSDNNLEGSLTRSLVNCQELENLDLGNNEIEDEFPGWLESLPELQVLILRSNRFHGPIGEPQSLFPFPKLHILDLSSNAFSSLLPREYFISFKAMAMVDGERVDMYYLGDSNYHESMISTLKGSNFYFDRISNIFATIDLSNNMFEGQIPEVVGVGGLGPWPSHNTKAQVSPDRPNPPHTQPAQ